MNIIDVQDKLKDFSEQQLIREMQMPSGTAPQFLVLSEIQRRKRMRDDFAKREAAQQQTVAQEAVAAAGVPNSGIAGMSEAMAPKSTMAQNAVGSVKPQAMRTGGLMRFAQELQTGIANQTTEEKIKPFIDEVADMAQTRLGVDLNQLGDRRPRMPAINMLGQRPISPPQGFPTQDPDKPEPQPLFPIRSKPPTIGSASPFRGGGKGGPTQMAGIGRLLNQGYQLQGYAEGGAVKMSRGGLFDAQGRPTEALLRALIAQESGGDPTARGSLDEVGISQIRPSTALMPGYGVTSMFPEIAAKIGEGKEYATVGEAYEANKELIDAGLEDPERSTAFTSDYLAAMRSRFDDDDRALAAYNVGPGGAAKLEDPSQFGYVADVRSRLDDEPGMLDGIGSMIAGAADAVGEAIVPSAGAATLGQEMTEVEEGSDGFNFDQLKRAFMYPAEIFGVPVPADAPGRPIYPTSNVVEKPSDLLGPFADVFEPSVTDDDGSVGADGLTKTQRFTLDNYPGPNARQGIIDDMSGTPGVIDSPNTGGDISPIPIFPPDAAGDPEIIPPLLQGDDGEPITKGEAGVVPKDSPEANDPIVITPDPQGSGALVPEDDPGIAAQPDFTPEEDDKKDDKAPEKDEEKSGDTTLAPTTIIGGEGGTYDASGVSSEIQRLKDRLEKDRDSDKWLALAQAGLALMSSKEPTLLGAAGEAGLSGLTAFREAQERYQEGVIDLINAQAKLKSKSGSLTPDEAISAATKLEAEARQLDGLDPARANLLRAQAQRLFAIGGLPVGGGGNIPDLSAPAS